MSAWAQSPVESVISAYGDARGVKTFTAKGAVMTFARRYMRRTPIGPLADKVETVSVLKLERASEEVKTGFLSALRDTLRRYDFYGVKPGEEDRPVEVYGTPLSDGYVHEIVVYNPDFYALFSMRGAFSMEELISLDKR